MADSIIKIGAVAATSGPVALLGKSFLRAVQLASEDVDGVKDTKHRYQLIIEEIPGTDKADVAIEKLLKSDRVNALVVATSASAQIVKPYATAARIALFCIASIGSVGDELYTFTAMPLAEDEAARWVVEGKRRGIKTIALLTQEYPSVNNHVRALKEEAAKAGIAVVFEDKAEGTMTDFQSKIEAMKASSPGIYFVEVFNPALDLLGQQLSDAGVRNMASIVALSLSEKPELFEGAWYTDSYVSPEFRAKLDRRYPDTRLATHMMPYAFDSYKILVDAFESGQDVLAYIRNMTDYAGTAGRIAKAAGTGNFRSSPALWAITNGRATLVAP